MGHDIPLLILIRICRKRKERIGRRTNIRSRITNDMDGSNGCTGIQISALQLCPQCPGFVFPVLCKIAGFSECLHMKICVRVRLPIHHAHTSFIGYRLYCINIDPVGILFIRGPLKQPLCFCRCILQKLILLFPGIALTHDNNHKIFLIITCLVNGINGSCRCLVCRCLVCHHRIWKHQGKQ